MARQHTHGASPSTQQIRTVGQRRREAEEKLEHHLDEARHKDDHRTPEQDDEDTQTGSQL
ncbi:hypothetical protein [Pseudarthrobacter sp. fls2-241-R2A-127]|uniref:hypothetical protein n=1 Tax=Pseudarthrobacter sp. fls2-241-R2A-127 TaxID=3040303 RepID=UPI002557053E|nr:hypothetical protein [Pseudarthrobacter sp. fls2-241-R2A-127]